MTLIGLKDNSHIRIVVTFPTKAPEGWRSPRRSAQSGIPQARQRLGLRQSSGAMNWANSQRHF
jgi:hypothetical protein